MKKYSLVLALIVSIALSGCENYLTRKLGGNLVVQVPPNSKVLNCTWKENSLWVLYENTQTHQPFFREYSQYGLLDGEVVFTAQQ